MTGEGTFDLAGHTLTAAYAADALWTNRLDLIGGGTIAFEVPKGALTESEKDLLVWDDEPSAGTSFVRAPNGHYAVTRRAGGVTALRAGLVIIFR